MSARDYIIDSDAGMRDILARCKRVAVIGIKTEAQGSQPAYYVPKYMQAAGYEIIPVPVYYPDVAQILGVPVHRKLTDIPGGQVDLVNVFRRPADVASHVAEILEARPYAVWLQLGIRNDEAASAFAAAGIRVVQDRCIMVEHRLLMSRS